MTNFKDLPPDTSDRPCWVVLGGPANIAGIYMDERPANIAMGKFPSLLPIVVATKNYADALVVDDLRAALGRKGIDRNDYPALRAFFASEEVGELLTKYAKFYAIRVGKETGVWVDYTWDEIVHLKNFTDARWKSHPTLQDALLWMLEKAPHNRPPKKMPASGTTPVKPPIPGEDHRAHPIPYPQGASFPHLGTARTHLPLSVCADPPHHGTSPSKPAKGSPIPTASMQSLSLSPTALQPLQMVIRPLASQAPYVAGLSAFNLGPHANAFLRGRDVDDGVILKILRARLYTDSCDDFSHWLSVELNWKESDSKELWKIIDIPGI